ncbi:MAG: hypothetical protein LBL87_04130 [Ruminococcus sp.]|jgi:hypothetical protein|nr:hypothetical protein [Ruminococcus sp.]
MEELIPLLNEKIQILECYEQATLRMVYEDIYSFGDILSDRQLLVPRYEDINRSIDKAIAALPEDIRAEVQALITHGKTESEALSEAALLIGRSDKLLESITKNDKLAVSRVKKEREEIIGKIEGTQKSEQVIKYVSANAYDTSRGAKFNQKM